jgi:predicted transposase YbfD/YdcC
MDININLENLKERGEKITVDAIKFQKMLLIYNCVEEGWNVKKKHDSYVFSKPHENKKEVFENSYLLSFMKTNLNLNKIVSLV